MDLVKCPQCGELYSDSYKRCPFCEEDEEPQKLAYKPHNVRHGMEHRHEHSAIGGMIVALCLVLAVLSWYLFGYKLIEKPEDLPGSTDVEDTEQPPEPHVSEDPFLDENPGGTDVVTPPEENVDVSNAALNRSDFTLSKAGETFQMKVSGTEATPLWSIDNGNVATIDADGNVRALADGQTKIHAKVGNRTLDCTLYVRGTGQTAAPASEPTVAEPKQPEVPTQPEQPTETETPSDEPVTVDASKLAIRTDLSGILPKESNGRYDCTIKLNQKVTLQVSGTDAPVTWSSSDNSIVSVDGGKLTLHKAGTAIITAKVGGATLECTVRVK